MWQYDCGALPVTDSSGRLAGIVTDRDICLALGARNARPSDLKVVDILRDSVFFYASGDEVGSAVKRMRENRVRYMPVVDVDLRVEGILSITDIALRAVTAPPTSPELSYSDANGALQPTYRHAPAAMGPCAG
jgi:CBS domain-containing protein